MPFDSVTPTGRRVRMGCDNGLTMAVHDNANGEKHLSIRIGGDLAKRLGWVRGERVDFREGSGGDAGYFKIVRVSSGGRKLTCPESVTAYVGFKFNLSDLRHHVVPDEARPQIECSLQAFGGEILGVFPEWAKPKAA